MPEIELNAGEVLELFRNGNIEFGKKKSVILLKDDIVINDNGRVFVPATMHISYERRESLLEKNIQFIQNLVCEHFNLEPYQVMYLSGKNEEYEFRIALTPNNLGQIVVLTKELALCSIRELGEISTNKNFAGLYRQLNNSYYYFRWYEE